MTSKHCGLEGCTCPDPITETTRRRWRTTHSTKRRHRQNERSRDKAIKYRHEWTGPELEIASRRDLTAAQVAEMLGRTVHAVHHIRRRLREEPRDQKLAGIPTGVLE